MKSCTFDKVRGVVLGQNTFNVRNRPTKKKKNKQEGRDVQFRGEGGKPLSLEEIRIQFFHFLEKEKLRFRGHIKYPYGQGKKKGRTP